MNGAFRTQHRETIAAILIVDAQAVEVSTEHGVLGIVVEPAGERYTIRGTGSHTVYSLVK